jgi:hypothetical protein
MEANKAKYQERIYYVDFDFHALTKGNKFNQVDVLVQRIDDLLNFYEYYSECEGNASTEQKGVLRINCLDCLDRTNYVMNRVGWYVM